MPKSETPKNKDKKAKKATKSSSHFPSKPYMRTLRAQSPTSVPTAAWSTTDDELLLRTKSSGKKWVDISPLFPGKTSNACRKRHARLVTHAEVEWDELKVRDLAVEFVNAKVGFFKMIAGNMKLEWRQVEKKCLELGFKTLLEKGKRVNLPFPPLEFQQDSTIGAAPEDMARRDLSLGSQISSELLLPPSPRSSTFEAKVEVQKLPENGDVIPLVRPPKRRKRVVKEESTIDRDGDTEDMSRDGGDELDELDDEAPGYTREGECTIGDAEL